MKNWLGQDIEVGTVVYRGARLRNGSEYKVGVVSSIKDGNKVQVEWKYEHGNLWDLIDTGQKWSNGTTRYDRQFVAHVPYPMNSKGNPNPESLIVLDDSYLLRLDAIHALATEHGERQDTNPMSKEEFLDRMNRL